MTAAAQLTTVGGSNVLGDGGIACVIDLDNILHRGVDEEGVDRDHGQLDVVSFAAALRNRGVARGLVVRNRGFSILADKMWASLGLSVRAVGKNCDDEVIAAAEGYVRAGARELILCAGDSDYCSLVRRMRARGVRVECWTRRRGSAKLMRLSDGFRFVDGFISAPREQTANDNQGPVAVPTNVSTAVQKLLIEFVSVRGARSVKFNIAGPSTVLCGVDRLGRPFRLEIDDDDSAWMRALQHPHFRPSATHH
jgi:NYN domain-containing protein